MKRIRKRAVARFTGSYRNSNQALADWEAQRDEEKEKAGLVIYPASVATPAEAPVQAPRKAVQQSLFGSI